MSIRDWTPHDAQDEQEERAARGKGPRCPHCESDDTVKGRVYQSAVTYYACMNCEHDWGWG